MSTAASHTKPKLHSGFCCRRGRGRGDAGGSSRGVWRGLRSPPHDGRARPQHIREQVRPGRGHEVLGVDAGTVRRHVPGGRDEGAGVRCQGSACSSQSVSPTNLVMFGLKL